MATKREKWIRFSVAERCIQSSEGQHFAIDLLDTSTVAFCARGLN